VSLIDLPAPSGDDEHVMETLEEATAKEDMSRRIEKGTRKK
jgi:hypothetical protein